MAKASTINLIDFRAYGGGLDKVDFIIESLNNSTNFVAGTRISLLRVNDLINSGTWSVKIRQSRELDRKLALKDERGRNGKKD